MAEIFTEVFGDKLAKRDGQELVVLPSPEDLQNKILLKVRLGGFWHLNAYILENTFFRYLSAHDITVSCIFDCVIVLQVDACFLTPKRARAKFKSGTWISLKNLRFNFLTCIWSYSSGATRIEEGMRFLFGEVPFLISLSWLNVPGRIYMEL